jgi:asparagine synthase (glutamine-hydrolysing)
MPPVCGICGATRDPGGRSVAAMNAAMPYRGPDDEGVHAHSESGAALGARRLSIIDVDGGHQPVSNEDATIWAVLNGEIYNHPALQARLARYGHKLASRTDTEVLVHLYEDLGDELVHALDGMYAFAIWDQLRRRMVLARDRFGEKPLFYRVDSDGRLTFASELRALLAGLDSMPELDPEAIDAFLVLGYVPGERTLYKGVHQLLPGNLLTWSDGVLTTRRYWDMPVRASHDTAPIADLLDEAEFLLRRAVKNVLVSDVPLGVFLSGGIDSTLVTSLAAQEAGHEIKSFTVAYDVGSVNESSEAREAAKAVGTDHHELILTGADVADRVPALLRCLDQPNADPALVALHAVAGLAHQHVKVAVGGEGADELFGGYPRYRWLERAERLHSHVPSAAAAAGASLLGFRRAPSDGRGRRLVNVLEPGDMVERHIDWVTDGRRTLRDIINGARLRDLNHATTVVDDARQILATSADPTVAGAYMTLDYRRYLPDDVLAKADRASMLQSLEVRTPFLNRELAEFSATVTTKTHLRSGGKAILRGLLPRVVPDLGSARPKTAFRVPLADWLRGPLAPALRRLTTDGPAVKDGWLDPAGLKKLCEEHLSGHADHSSSLWPAFVLDLWLDS